MDITINAEQQLYVIPCGGGYTCFGFKNARAHAEQIAHLLGRDDLMPLQEEFGTVAGYRRYERAVAAFGSSVASKRTYFDPGTAPEVRKILDRFRENERTIRLFLGDPKTGTDWGEENDVVGTIGRSGGTMKVPLLIPSGECGGTAILTACIVRLIDVERGQEVYRCATYQAPDVTLAQCEDKPGYAWEALRDGKVLARFATVEEAGEYVGFIRGTIPAKHEHYRLAFRAARRA